MTSLINQNSTSASSTFFESIVASAYVSFPSYSSSSEILAVFPASDSWHLWCCSGRHHQPSLPPPARHHHPSPPAAGHHHHPPPPPSLNLQLSIRLNTIQVDPKITAHATSPPHALQTYIDVSSRLSCSHTLTSAHEGANSEAEARAC